MIDTAIATSNELPTGKLEHRFNNREDRKPEPSVTTFNVRQSPFKHVSAAHSKTRTSILSHDAESVPSFVGFRNLMVLLLSASPCWTLPCPTHCADRKS